MTLDTNLKHIQSESDLKSTINNNENVMVSCGRMGPMCIPVYKTMESLEKEYSHVVFRDFLFDHPDADVIKNLPECRGFMGLPFTVYYKNGKVVHATTSLQTKGQILKILDKYFPKK